MSSAGPRDRFYSAPPATHNVGMQYAWSPSATQTGGANTVTGNWQPVTADSNGNLNVAIAGGVSISGASISIDAVAVTGNPVFSSTGNQPVNVVNTAPIAVSGVVLSTAPALQAISGIVTTAPAALQAVSGFVNVANTAPVPISGVVQAAVTIGNVAVTGGSIVGIDTGNRATNIINPIIAISGFVNTIVTGAISASVDVSPVVLAQASGNAYLAFISGRELINGVTLSGISGQLASNLTDPAGVTGTVGITNTLFAVSGITQIGNTAPIPFSGVVQSNITTSLLAVSGNTVAQITGFNSGIVVSTQPVTKTVVSNSTPSGVSPWTSMTVMQTGQIGANPNRVLLFVQNIHTGTPLLVALNNTAASTGNFNFILNPSTVQGYGGSSFSDDHYRGPVQISGGAYMAWEL